jgi:Mrp family chromosome partitioning ATPase
VINFLEQLRRGWKILLLVAVPLTAGVIFYAERLPNEYTATAVVSFSPRTDAAVGADVVRIVLPKYRVYAESDGAVPRAARTLGVPESQIESGLEVTIPLDTSNVEIAVTNEDPVTAARAANAIARDVVSLSKQDPLLKGSLVARARPPSSPSGPPRRMLELAGAVGALLAGIGVMLLRDHLRPVVRTANDAAEAAKLRLVGVLPRSAVLAGPPKLALADVAVGPAVRNLRTQLDRVLRREAINTGRGRVLAVTSATQAEGKSVVAALVAMASARLDQHVLLIDGDLLLPSVGITLDLPPSLGLAHALRARATDFTPYVRDVAPNLSVMPTSTDRDAGDLAARGLAGVFEWAADRFDLVVVDAPPMFGNDVGPTIALLADTVLVVVRRGTRTADVEEAVGVLRSLEADLVGVVANGTTTPDEYSYG